MMIPDAPYIRDAERLGCEYMYQWVGYDTDEPDEDDNPDD